MLPIALLKRSMGNRDAAPARGPETATSRLAEVAMKSFFFQVNCRKLRIRVNIWDFGDQKDLKRGFVEDFGKGY